MRSVENLAKTALLELFVLHLYRTFAECVSREAVALKSEFSDEQYDEILAVSRRLADDELEDLRQIVIAMEERLASLPALGMSTSVIARIITGAFPGTLRTDVRQHLFARFEMEAGEDGDGDLQKFFHQLASDEVYHEKAIARLYDLLNPGKPLESVFMGKNQLRDYLTSCFKTSFVGDPNDGVATSLMALSQAEAPREQLKHMLGLAAGIYWSYCNN